MQFFPCDETEWFRFIVPIFLHVGVVHFLLNMLAQWMVAGQLEREMGMHSSAKSNLTSC